MFEYIFGIDYGVPIDTWLDFGEIYYIDVSQTPFSEAIIFLVDPYY